MYCHKTSEDSYENRGVFTKRNQSTLILKKWALQAKTPGRIVPHTRAGKCSCGVQAQGRHEEIKTSEEKKILEPETGECLLVNSNVSQPILRIGSKQFKYGTTIDIVKQSAQYQAHNL